MAEVSIFDSYVINSILANNQFGIKEVSELRSLNDRYFVTEEYSGIEGLIRNKDLEGIELLPNNESEEKEFKQFLHIMFFKDQNLIEYIVTVYDSIALEQDPQVIEIFPL